MKSIKGNIWTLLVIVPTVLIFLLSCSESITDNPVENIAPNTFLFLYPDEDTEVNQQKSRITIHWWGDDPDGVIVGFYYIWEGLEDEWTFTVENEITFSLPIGTVDTTYNFKIIAVDYEGNGIYDESVDWNGTNLGGEPYFDENKNGRHDDGEIYLDLGLFDPTPAVQIFPIKNSPPTVKWTEASNLPLSSLPVITVGWDSDDLDGKESIVQINIALNDTSEWISLSSNVNLVTLRLKNGDIDNPLMEILINGSDDNIFEEKLANLKLNDNNRLYIQAVDISGSKSSFVALPDSGRDWYVQKQNGPLLIVDNYESGESAVTFYEEAFNSIDGGTLVEKYNLLDLENAVLPYQNITLLETMKLFDYTYWYTDNTPSFELLNVVTQDYLNSHGKIAISMTVQEATENFPVDLPTLQNFLPIEGFGEEDPLRFLFAGAFILSTDSFPNFPNLQTTATISHVRTYVPSSITLDVYDLSSDQASGTISFMDNSKSLFYIGLPLHQCDGINGNVSKMLEQLFIKEFGLEL